MPDSQVMHHGIISICRPEHVTVVDFTDKGVAETGLAKFAAGHEVYLVDYWDKGSGLKKVSVPPSNTLDRIKEALESPRRQDHYSISHFNCEHWAT